MPSHDRDIVHNGYRIRTSQHGPHGFRATAIAESWDMRNGYPSEAPNVYHSGYHRGKGAKEKAVAEVCAIVAEKHPEPKG